MGGGFDSSRKPPGQGATAGDQLLVTPISASFSAEERAAPGWLVGGYRKGETEEGKGGEGKGRCVSIEGHCEGFVARVEQTALFLGSKATSCRNRAYTSMPSSLISFSTSAMDPSAALMVRRRSSFSSWRVCRALSSARLTTDALLAGAAEHKQTARRRRRELRVQPSPGGSKGPGNASSCATNDAKG